jgi:hypothetical protein
MVQIKNPEDLTKINVGLWIFPGLTRFASNSMAVTECLCPCIHLGCLDRLVIGVTYKTVFYLAHPQPQSSVDLAQVESLPRRRQVILFGQGLMIKVGMMGVGAMGLNFAIPRNRFKPGGLLGLTNA